MLLLLAFPAVAGEKPVVFPTGELTIRSGEKTHAVRIEIATTEEQLKYGLMQRRHLAAGRGMLFIFPRPQIVAMWMKDTLIPLDMLFADEKGAVNFIAENMKPMSERIVRSPYPTRVVLELPGGSAKRLNLQPGDTLHYAPVFP